MGESAQLSFAPKISLIYNYRTTLNPVKKRQSRESQSQKVKMFILRRNCVRHNIVEEKKQQFNDVWSQNEQEDNGLDQPKLSLDKYCYDDFNSLPTATEMQKALKIYL
jgi:hypothetical protein